MATAVKKPGAVKQRRKSNPKLPTIISHPKKLKQVLEALADECRGNVTWACQHVGINARTFYQHMKDDPKVRELVDEAIDQSTDHLEREAMSRGMEGYRTNVEYDDKGKIIKETIKKSDTLLIFMMKGRRPDVYRDNATVRLAGHDGGQLQIGSQRQHTLDAFLGKDGAYHADK